MCIDRSLEPGCGARVSRKSISVVDSFSLPQLLVAVLASWGSQDEGNWNLKYSFLAPSRVHKCKTDREWPCASCAGRKPRSSKRKSFLRTLFVQHCFTL